MKTWAELSQLVGLSLHPQSDSDRKLALPYCDFWLTKAATVDSLQTVSCVLDIPFNNSQPSVQCTLASPWIPLMAPMGVVRYFDNVVRALERGCTLDDTGQCTINVVLHTLGLLSTKTEALAELQHRISGLITIRPFLLQTATLDNLLLQIVDTRLPLGCDSLPLTLKQSHKISDITLSAQERWMIRSANWPLDPAVMSIFLNLEDWNATTAKIVSGSIYNSSASRHYFLAWLIKTAPARSSLEYTVIPLHAYLDVISLQSHDGMTRFPDTWFLAVVQCLFRAETSGNLRTLCSSCIWLLFQNNPSSRDHYVTFLSSEVQENAAFVNSYSMRLFCDLNRLDVAALAPVLLEVTDKALTWMVHRLSGVELSEDDIAALDEICESPSECNLEGLQYNHY